MRRRRRLSPRPSRTARSTAGGPAAPRRPPPSCCARRAAARRRRSATTPRAAAALATQRRARGGGQASRAPQIVLGAPAARGKRCPRLPPSPSFLPACLAQRIPAASIPPPPPPPGPEERSCSRGLGSQTEHDETEGQGGMTRQAGERPRRASEVATAPNSSSSLPTNPTHQQPLSLPAGRRSGCA